MTGIERFEFFLAQLEMAIQNADKQKNPALYLYQHNARTPLFMLEGLSKMHMEIHNHKKFGKLKEQFKLLEDALGAIDYYDVISKNLSSNKKIPIKVKQYLQAQTREKIQRLNELLEEKKWVDSGNSRLAKIRKKLQDADWRSESSEIKAIEKFYRKSISDIIDFSRSEACHYDNMEDDVHELRRKLRWLSIYPQALKGCIQLTASQARPTHLKKYLTDAIVNSPYNKMPDAGDCKYFLMLEKNYFLALSWMIDALGKLKDDGLQVIAVKEALQQASNLDEAAAIKKAYQMLGSGQSTLPALLKKAAGISNTYFKEQNLERLIIGTGKSA